MQTVRRIISSRSDSAETLLRTCAITVVDRRSERCQMWDLRPTTEYSVQKVSYDHVRGAVRPHFFVHRLPSLLSRPMLGLRRCRRSLNGFG